MGPIDFESEWVRDSDHLDAALRKLTNAVIHETPTTEYPLVDGDQVEIETREVER